jgi:protocatechuate 3,4-dioxygenase alpha subunit
VLPTPESVGERIRIEGRVLDGDRNHIEDALIELWQADSAGRYHHPADDRVDIPLDPSFSGFGRCASDFKTGAYSFLTIKPGPVPHPNGGLQAPHISLTIQARGMLNPTFTRVYFDDEAGANAADPVLQTVPEAPIVVDRRASRRQTTRRCPPIDSTSVTRATTTVFAGHRRVPAPRPDNTRRDRFGDHGPHPRCLAALARTCS